MSVPKDPMDRVACEYTASFAPDQCDVLRLLTVGQGRSYSQLVEAAFASYIPQAFHQDWPSAPRMASPNRKPKQSRIYGVMFTHAQDEVLRRILRTHPLGFSELIERAFADYIPAEFDMEWPPSKRLSRVS